MAGHELGRSARYDAAALGRLSDWIGDDLRVWAYARRREQNWIVSVPAFSIVTGDAGLETAFNQANALLVDRLMACLDAHVAIDQSARPLPRRTRAALFLDAVLAEATGTARRRPPRVQRMLVTSRSLNLLPAPSLPMIQERLQTIRRGRARRRSLDF